MIQYTVVRIGIVIFLIYTIGFVFTLFVEFGMKKKLLDINSAYTLINVTMPEHSHHISIQSDEIKSDEANLTIRRNGIIIYTAFIDKKNTSFSTPIVLKEKGYPFLLKGNTKYTLEIQVKKLKKPFNLWVSWLAQGRYTIFEDVITVLKHRGDADATPPILSQNPL